MTKGKILHGCPDCRRVQHIKNYKCKYCGNDLQKAKRKAYYVQYSNLQGVIRRERAGYSLSSARQFLLRISAEANSIQTP